MVVVAVPDSAVIEAVFLSIDERFYREGGESDELGFTVEAHTFEEVDADDGENKHDEGDYYEQTSNCRK